MKYKKLTKAEQKQLEELIDRAQCNGQPIPPYSNILVGANPTPLHGDFTVHARVAQQLQDTKYGRSNYSN